MSLLQPAMNPEEVSAIRTTFEAVSKDTQGIAALFYQKLFTLDPTLKALFHGDMRSQGEKLIGMLALVVSNLENIEQLLPTVRQLGQRHAGYGVKEAHYATVRTALLAALEEQSGAAWSARAEKAWAAAYDLLARTMMSGARGI